MPDPSQPLLTLPQFTPGPSSSSGSTTSATYTSSQYQCGEDSRIKGRPVLTDAQRWRHACGAKDLRKRPDTPETVRPSGFTLSRSASSSALDVVRRRNSEFNPSYPHRHSGVHIRALNPPPDSDDIVDAFISEVLHVARTRRHTADPRLSPASVCTPLLTPSTSTNASVSPLGTPFSNIDIQQSPFDLLSNTLITGPSGSHEQRNIPTFTHPPIPDLKQPPRSRNPSATGSVASNQETIAEESRSASESPTPAPTPQAMPSSPSLSVSRPRTVAQARAPSTSAKSSDRPLTLSEIVLAFGGSGSPYSSIGIPTPVSSNPQTPVPRMAGPFSLSSSS